MALILFGGAENNNGDDLNNAKGGTNSFWPTTGTSHPGISQYTYRTDPSLSGVGWFSFGSITTNGTTGTASVSAYYFSVNIYIGTLPSANNEEIIGVRQATGERFWIRINSSGNLLFYDSSLTLLATGTTTLSTSTWYRIHGVINMGTSATVTIKIDGATEFTSTTVNTGATNFTLFILGKRTNRNSQSILMLYDDLILDTTTEPGDWYVGAAVPTANGSTMQWTAGTGSSNYAEVDEIAPSTTDYVQTTSTAGDVALFTTQSMSTLGISGATVKGIEIFAYSVEPTAVTSSDKIRLRSNGTNSDTTTARNLTTTYSDWYHLAETDPSGGGAWTEARTDAAEIGVVEANAVAVRLASVIKYILYEPAAPAAGTSNLPLLGVG